VTIESDDGARRILDARTRELALRERDGDDREETLSVLLVTVAAEGYALDLAFVGGVTPAVPCTSLPGAQPALLGLFVHGGELYGAIEVARLLGTSSAEASGGHYILLKDTNPAAALRVDHAAGILVVNRSDLTSASTEAGPSPVSLTLPMESGEAVGLLDLAFILRSAFPSSSSHGA
jgi:chemotaxis signal transduction protein